MSDHTEACDNSQMLCDMLYQCLARRIPNLKRGQTKRWCPLYQLGRSRFAYVNHRKSMSRIEVWCLGDPAELQQRTSINIVPRTEIKSGGWEERFQTRFRVSYPSQIESACKILYEVSYQLS